MNRANTHSVIKNRIRKLNNIPALKGNVCYLLSRDQRVSYNHALLYAQKLAINYKSKLFVLFNLVPTFLGATIRQYNFMLRGLLELSENLRKFNIPLYITIGDPEVNIPKFIKANSITHLITDFDPLRIKKNWKNNISKAINITFEEIDTHNTVPAFYISDKKEYGAYTIRKKINRLIPEFLIKPEPLIPHPFNKDITFPVHELSDLEKALSVDISVQPVSKFIPGENAARRVLEDFVKHKLYGYAEKRNNPLEDFQSNLSPYLHFGQISSIEVALEVLKASAPEKSKRAFLEELIIRKELSDNYCFYEENYDNFEGLPEWAKETLNQHRRDNRPFLYTREKLESAETHDNLWNAAQKQMCIEGKMHGYMRMYWAKKILEWTETPEEAIDIAIYLNDKYELDGRDPNGYTGIMWSIGGLHDRPWKERSIYGKIRYLSYEGCKRKFDVEKFIEIYGKD